MSFNILFFLGSYIQFVLNILGKSFLNVWFIGGLCVSDMKKIEEIGGKEYYFLGSVNFKFGFVFSSFVENIVLLTQ